MVSTPLDSDVKNSDPIYNHTLGTYRNLRIAMVALVLLLFAGVAWQVADSGCLQGSISAYYYTGAHSIFVSVLCALGACLLIYKGSSDVEDILLNYSGFLAFIVAMSPTGWPKELVGGESVRAICGGHGLPPSYDVAAIARQNVWVVLIAGLLIVIGRFLLRRWIQSANTRSVLGVVARVLGLSVVVALVVIFVGFPNQFEKIGHGLAAIPMFVGIVGVVCTNAILAGASSSPDQRRYAPFYGAIAFLMLLSITLVIYLKIAHHWMTAVFWIEVILILLFASFWAVQSRELWNVVGQRPMRAGQLGKARMLMGPHA